MSKKSGQTKVLHALMGAIWSPLVLSREAWRLSQASARSAVESFPKSAWRQSRRSSLFLGQKAWAEVVGDTMLGFLNEAGPFYGKMMQIILSRLDAPTHSWAEQWRLTKVYSDWPALKVHEIEAILDQDIPKWRDLFEMESHPIGVASMGQVHGAVDRSGREWVVKVLKPHAVLRLNETIATFDSLLKGASLFAVTAMQKRVVRELEIFLKSLRQETSLQNEKAAIKKMLKLCSKKSLSRVVIPEVWDELCTPRVLVVQRFRGMTFQDLIEGKGTLSAEERQNVARDVLQELLVQVFDLGFFHADPHAGNLILLEDGRVGLFDWGLSGELSPADREHISSILRAVMARDLMQLARTLQQLAVDAGMKRAPAANVIWAELQKMLDGFKQSKTGKQGMQSLSIEQLVGACTQCADRLQIPLPMGLMLMMKSLVTIEGLAKGIDPEISLMRVAGPVLFRAARPGIKDIWRMVVRLPGWMN